MAPLPLGCLEAELKPVQRGLYVLQPLWSLVNRMGLACAGHTSRAFCSSKQTCCWILAQPGSKGENATIEENILSFYFQLFMNFGKTNKKKSTNAGPTVVGAKGSKSSRPNKEKNWLQWLIMILCLGAFPTWTQYSVCEGGARGYPEVLSHLSYSHPSSHFSL